jgi:DNA-binding beta-propeller fold protein YncE
MLTTQWVGGRISYAGLRVPATAGEGKVTLQMDVLSSQDTVLMQGRRHAYLNVGCPPGLPEGVTDRFPVGAPPLDMALTDDERYLYVTRDVQRDPLSEDPKVTVIDLQDGAPVPEENIGFSEEIGFPAGVAASPGEPVMYIADSAFQSLHVVLIDEETHVLQESIELNPDGELGVTAPGDVAVNRAGTEVYVADSRGRRMFVVNPGADPPGVRVVSLAGFLEPPAGLRPVQVMPDPDNPRFVFALCQGQNELIKVDVVSNEILDFVQWEGLPTSSRSMVLDPLTNQIYVVVNPNDFELLEDPPSFDSKIIILPKNGLGGPGRGELPLVGSSIWQLVVREDGFVYAIDSYRGEILVIDVDTGTEMSRCAVPVEPAGGFLRADRDQVRLFVAGGLAGFVTVVE